MSGTEALSVNGTDSAVIEEVLIDPETEEELVFRAETEEELEALIEAHFNPFHETEDESTNVG